ncbi:MAG: GTPase HflX, partial [Bacilli bacterium]
MPNKKSAILVGVKLPHFTDFAQAFEELDNLALACDYYVLKKVTQTLDAPTNHYYLGSGKVSEIKAILEETGAKTAIFDTELSPVHIRNLEKALDVDIVDRTMLILQIFESRAKTKEAKLQVAVAKASYMLPRLIDHEANYDRQRAGGKANKGSGETKLEKDKRTLRNAIIKYKKELATLTEKRRVQRLQRKDKQVFTVAIVGYTNAGKSALMNQFLSIAHRSHHKKVLEKDMVFATLETSSRLISLPNLIKFIAVDTVGFVRRLPHHLIEAFKSTLEEVKEADLILHVVDISDPEFLHLLTVADEVLQSL